MRNALHFCHLICCCGSFSRFIASSMNEASLLSCFKCVIYTIQVSDLFISHRKSSSFNILYDSVVDLLIRSVKCMLFMNNFKIPMQLSKTR